MSERVSFAQVKQNHKDWVAKIKDYLYDNGQLKLDEIMSEKTGKVGLWLYSDGHKNYGHVEDLVEFEIKNIKIHKLAVEIFELKNEKQDGLAAEYFSDLLNTSESILALLTSAEKTLNSGLAEEQEIVENSHVAVVWDKAINLIVETNRNGKVVFVNNNFVVVSGYEDMEIIGKPFSIFLSDDMPQVIYNYMIDGEKNTVERPAFLKLSSKTGKYYWVYAQCKFILDSNNNIDSMTLQMTGTSKSLIETHIEDLYSTIKKVEIKKNVAASTKYFESHLAMRNRDYTDFVVNLVQTNQDTIKINKKGFGGFLKKLGA